jgi:hypothetical protein
MARRAVLAIWFWLDRHRGLRDRAMFHLAIEDLVGGCGYDGANGPLA